MVTETYHYWMGINAPLGSGKQQVFMTILVDNKTVHASIALNALSFGFDSDSAGGVGAAIAKYHQRLHFEDVVLEPSFKHSSVFVENCTSVTFVMTAKIAWGFAVATLLVHG